MRLKFFQKSIAATGSTLCLAVAACGQDPAASLSQNNSLHHQPQAAPLFPPASPPEVVIKGGSNGVMIVESKDARISLEAGQVLRHIFLDPEVYQIFWDGVLNDKFQYLRIDHCRFFVLYSSFDDSIYAYDYRGYRYLVSALDMTGKDLVH